MTLQGRTRSDEHRRYEPADQVKGSNHRKQRQQRPDIEHRR